MSAQIKRQLLHVVADVDGREITMQLEMGADDCKLVYFQNQHLKVDNMGNFDETVKDLQAARNIAEQIKKVFFVEKPKPTQPVAAAPSNVVPIASRCNCDD